MKPVPKQYRDLNVQDLLLDNKTDADGNPTGGSVYGPGLEVHWQNGPRLPFSNGELGPSNGAFVEDVIYAALQRLEFFQTGKYATRENEAAIQCLSMALGCLDNRRQNRKNRGVEGQHQI